MDWHARYTQQANWTRDLRAYLFEKTELSGAGCALEVGCGTGAILSEVSTQADLHGLDIDPDTLAQ
jgi:ubiquinone/menaquinone biosynthesis C-methylase UbiE